jgi:hypothetical protein
MAQPLVVVIPHQLGAEEARRRIEAGLEKMRAQFASQLSASEVAWAGDQAAVHVAAMGQRIDAKLDVAPDNVRVEIVLPWLLARFAEKAQGWLTKAGTDILSLPPPKA